MKTGMGGAEEALHADPLRVLEALFPTSGPPQGQFCPSSASASYNFLPSFFIWLLQLIPQISTQNHLLMETSLGLSHQGKPPLQDLLALNLVVTCISFG